MDGSQWVALIYTGVGVIAFPFLVRWFWKEELRKPVKNGDSSLGFAGLSAFCVCFFWPLIVSWWVCMGALELITIGIEKDDDDA